VHNRSTRTVATQQPGSGRVDDAACVAFLQWALPRLGLRWAGYRKVRRQVCRRLRARVAELGLADLDAYRAHLDADPAEWEVLRALTPVTISRFARDRAVFDALEREVVPGLERAARAEGREGLRAWSAGCASGEEAYTLALLWPAMDVLATDVHAPVLERARRARYPTSSLRELTAAERDRGFVADGAEHAVRPEVAARVTVVRHDLREPPPAAAPFDLVLCRNAAFTYLDADARRAVLDRLADALVPRGALVVGRHETLPDTERFRPWPGARPQESASSPAAATTSATSVARSAAVVPGCRMHARTVSRRP
jgi:chemotaxis protein methyltransferase CheR